VGFEQEKVAMLAGLAMFGLAQNFKKRKKYKGMQTYPTYPT